MSKPVVLMVLSRHPYAERSGRGFMLRQRIAQLGAAYDLRIVVMGAPAGDASDDGIVFLALASPASVALNAARLSNRPLQTWLYFNADAAARIAHLARESRAVAVYVDMLRLAPLAAALPNRIALAVDYDDLLSERYRLAASDGYDVMGFLSQRVGPLAPLARAFARPLLRAEGRRCAAYEQETMQRADLAIFTSPREAAAMRGKAQVIAAPPEMAPRAAPEALGRRLIFLGNMRYAENIAMVQALATAAAALSAQGAWPVDARIEAVGDHAADLPARLGTAPIRFLGRIDDLSTLAGAGIFLAPVIGGSGVKIKVLDGMALGCPVAATAKACEGLSVRANRDLIVAPNAEGVLAAALKLRDRPALKAMLAQRGRAYLECAHGPAIGAQLRAAFAAAIVRAQSR